MNLILVGEIIFKNSTRQIITFVLRENKPSKKPLLFVKTQNFNSMLGINRVGHNRSARGRDMHLIAGFTSTSS